MATHALIAFHLEILSFELTRVVLESCVLTESNTIYVKILQCFRVPRMRLSLHCFLMKIQTGSVPDLRVYQVPLGLNDFTDGVFGFYGAHIVGFDILHY